jgi:hypothetical protein
MSVDHNISNECSCHESYEISSKDLNHHDKKFDDVPCAKSSHVMLGCVRSNRQKAVVPALNEESRSKTRLHCIDDSDIAEPEIGGCEKWRREFARAQHQVGQKSILDLIFPNPDDFVQVGHARRHLCSIVNSLPDELDSALREAWVASMVKQHHSQLIAQDSLHNRMRDVATSVLRNLGPTTVPRYLSTIVFQFSKRNRP